MKRVFVPQRALSGQLPIIPSKGAAHRALICAALSEESQTNRGFRVAPLQASQDMRATIGALSALGCIQEARWEENADGTAACRITGQTPEDLPREVFCGESGSTLRFLIPLALHGDAPVTFTGAGRLMERPLSPYEACFREKGILWERNAGRLTVSGRLSSGVYRLPGDVSSQFVSGLLFALPRLSGDSQIRLTSPLESRGYVEMTLQALARSGVQAGFSDERTIQIPGGQTYAARDTFVPGDWSHAAFYLVAGAIAGDVRLTGLSLDHSGAQGDAEIVSLLRGMGTQIMIEEKGDFRALRSALHGREMDVRQVPDLVPALCVAACAAQGVTRLTGAARLRLKESDRLHAMALELRKLGAQIEELPDGLVIAGGHPLRHAIVSGHNDHRVVMALAICAALCEGGVTLEGAEAVSKSAPRFFEELSILGGAPDARTLGQ